MKGFIKKIKVLGFLGLLTYLGASCQKDQIAPANQETAFIKYYGHVGNQTASDVIKTSDGSFVLVGSTNAYSSAAESDIFVVKADSLGNELWSATLGKADGSSAVNFVGTGNYLRYDEEGIKIIELPDASAYVIAANRTYVNYGTATNVRGVRGQTKIVLYTIDPTTGAATTSDGVELREESNNRFTEEVSDMKYDPAENFYVLTGYTTNVRRSKTGDNPDGGISDKTDLFMTALDANFVSQWDTTNEVRGFFGEDYGASILVLPNRYVITGTHEQPGTNRKYTANLAIIVSRKSSGAPTNPAYYGDEDYDFEGGYSVYDSTQNLITVVANMKTGSNNNKGEMVLKQVEYIGNNLIDKDINNTLTEHSFGGYCYTMGNTTSPATQPYKVKSIAQIPGNEGFIVSSTQEKIDGLESSICIAKFTNTLELAEGWPFYFGYEDSNGLKITEDEAGTVMPITTLITGTSQSALSGYVFTGTFGLGTNNMMGLVKINVNGTLNP